MAAIKPETPAGPVPPAAPDGADINAFLASHPLFMTELPDAESEDPTLAALQSLAYDGTPDEIAANFKSQGNEYFKGKRYREAAGFYTQALDAQPEDKSLREALLLNRAACNLELQNYGRVLHDCAQAIQLNGKNSKAYYRSAQALYSLDRLPEALDAATRCLSFDPSNAAMSSILSKVQKRLADKDARERERLERVEEEQKLQRALRERNIYPEKNEEGKSTATSHDYRVRWDEEDPDSLIIPVFFLYPQHAITDAIPNFAEHTPFSAHLQAMFPPNAPPPAWDERREYVADKLVVYAVTRRKRVLKVGRRMSLADVCRSAGGKEGEEGDGLEMRDGGLAFAVLPKGEEEARWVAQVKKERGF